jgi:nicotinamide phosphoribosyltransferase
MLDQFPTGAVAVVSDSFDIFRACKAYWGTDLRDRVLSRRGTLVVRPDSGEPEEVVVQVLDILGQAFGAVHNDKGYKMLPPQIRVIQGDGVNYDSIKGILGNMEVHKWAAENVAFGMGGALLQQLNRDTQRFAFKCSEVTVDGVARPVRKKPVTADWKVSKPGRFQVGPEVFRNGEILVHTDFDEIRKRAALS